MRFEISEKDFFNLGLIKAGHSFKKIQRTCMETNLKRFKDSYYATPKTLHDIFIDIQSPDLGEKRIKNPNSGDFLLAMRFLKKYPTKYDLSAISDTTEKTALLRVWKYVKAIQALKEEKVRFLPCCDDNSLFLNLIFWYPMV